MKDIVKAYRVVGEFSGLLMEHKGCLYPFGITDHSQALAERIATYTYVESPIEKIFNNYGATDIILEAEYEVPAKDPVGDREEDGKVAFGVGFKTDGGLAIYYKGSWYPFLSSEVDEERMRRIAIDLPVGTFGSLPDKIDEELRGLKYPESIVDVVVYDLEDLG